MAAPLSAPIAWALAATLGAAGWLALHDGDDAAKTETVNPPRRAAAPAVRAGLAGPAVAPHAPDAPTEVPPPVTTSRAVPWPRPTDPALAAWSAPPPPPPPPRAAVAPPPPPEFPYRWIGRLEDGARTTALLASAQRSIGLREGDVLDGRWRLDRLSAQGMDLTWLPTGQVLTVPSR